MIACGSLRPELELLRGQAPGVEVRYLGQSLHRTPDQMPAALQAELDTISATVEQVVLGYGLCGGGVVGVRAPDQGLFIPRAHDCIALFLGSREAYERAFQKRAGSYYLTAGWVADRKDPLGVLMEEYVPRLGRAAAEAGLREELQHYTHIVAVVTEGCDAPRLRDRARANARFLGKEYEEVAGDSAYLRRVLSGPYDASWFVRVEPGQTVQQDPFLE